MSSKKITVKKKNSVVKTLQWVGISIISILLILYFLVSTGGSQTTPTIGSVNGTPIYYTSTSPYGRAFRDIERYYQQIGIPINNEMYSFIEDMAFKRAVTIILLDKIASENIKISDNLIVDAMKSEFVDTNGLYNDVAFQSFIKNTSKSEQKRIEKELKESILSQTISMELFKDKPELFSNRVFDRKREMVEERDIEMVYIDAASIVENSEIPISDLEKYFNDNKTNFAQADISYIALESGGVADNLYKSLKDDITLFDKNAIEKSIETNNYKLGYVTKMEMPSENFANSIFTNTKTNTLLQPIYVNGKYYIVLLNDIRLPEKYSDVKIDILKNEYLKSNMKALLEVEKTKQSEILKSAFENNNNLASLNNKGNIEYYKTSKPFYYNQANLSSINGNMIPESSEENFYRRVFSLEVGSVSDVVKLENGVAIIKVLSEEKPDMNKLATSDDSIKSAIKMELSSYIENEWQNKNIEKARVKKNNIR